MSPYCKTLWHAAECIRSRLKNVSQQKPPVTLPELEWTELRKLQRQLTQARARGFEHASHEVLAQFTAQIHHLQSELISRQSELRQQTDVPPPASTGEIYAELLALKAEHTEFQVDFEESHVSVVTEPVQLEGLHLGRFEIRLEWARIGLSAAPYRVIALDPNPASTNEDVTHPHINADSLCAGDGRRAIESALSAGRIADFFLLVERVLHTYSQGNAFVEIAAWDGVRCNDCGSTVSNDERFDCERCEDSLCCDCSRSCDACGCSCCSGCLASCANCDQQCCLACLDACAACGIDVCSECQTENLCRACHENAQSNPEEIPPATTTGPHGPIQPDSVVQTALSA
jgi:hypothetical protein